MPFRNAEELYDFYNGNQVDLNIVVDGFFFSDKIYRVSGLDGTITKHPVSREEFVMEVAPETLSALSVLIASWIRGFVAAIERMHLGAEGALTLFRSEPTGGNPMLN